MKILLSSKILDRKFVKGEINNNIYGWKFHYHQKFCWLNDKKISKSKLANIGISKHWKIKNRKLWYLKIVKIKSWNTSNIENWNYDINSKHWKVLWDHHIISKHWKSWKSNIKNQNVCLLPTSFICNIMLLQCSGAIFRCLSNVRVLMQYLGDDAVFGCWYNVQVLMQCLGVAIFNTLCTVWLLM